MKQYLLPNLPAYKACLHCHSTCSDGQLTPHELKDAYKAQGYAVLAITDHEVLLDHSYLNDENFLMLNAYEMAITQNAQNPEIPFIHKKTCHMNLFAKKPGTLKQVCFHPDDLYANAVQFAKQVQHDGVFKKEYTPECINHVVKTAVENGFLVAYNHPAWSLENAADYNAYNGFFAVEVYNHGCVLAGNRDCSPQPYHDMLRAGKRLFCLATDDAHTGGDLFGGYVMLYAKEFTYRGIIAALEKGDFYASTGPAINELYKEGNWVTLSTSPVEEVFITRPGRNCQRFLAGEGAPLTEIKFHHAPEEGEYFQISLFGKRGQQAYTRAYFNDEA